MKLTTHRLTPDKYPWLLQQIHPLPKFLEVAGVIPSDDQKFLCVVGSRTPSSYGIETCRKLILELQGQPVVIISGMAIGIDSIAHEAAIDAGLKTIAFPGSGLSSGVLYPPSRRNLAERIIESSGALVSSFPPEQMGAPWTFPVRNRWMAGMSHAVLIVEGRQGSGTLGTATYATELNRNVLIVPGSIFSELSYGPLLLMKEGATPVTNAAEIMSELTFTEERVAKVARSPERLAATLAEMKRIEEARLAGKMSGDTRPKNSRVNLDTFSLSPEERAICDHLRNGALDSSKLIEKTGFAVSLFNVTVSELEMKGLVVNSGGIYLMQI